MLISLETAKSFLGITNNDYNDLLNSIIAQSSDVIEKYCDRTFTLTTYTDKVMDGSGGYEQVMRQYPITAVSKIEHKVCNTWSDLSNDDYDIDGESGIIVKDSVFMQGRLNYRFSYTAGYSTIPNDLQLACCMLTSTIFSKRKGAGIKSESLGDHSVTFAEGADALSSDVKMILDKYKTMVV